LVPLVERFHVDGADFGVAALLQDANEVSTDEATGTGDDHEIVLGHQTSLSCLASIYLDYSRRSRPVL
jgi:hypothetical protein